MFFNGGTQNGLNLTANRGSNEKTASDWSIQGENAIRSEDESAPPQGNFGKRQEFGGYVPSM